MGRAPRIGLLDLDIFGPSVPKLMGLEEAGAPELSDGEAHVSLEMGQKYMLMVRQQACPAAESRGQDHVNRILAA
jgi:Mrp family chromosome partitioning ATPase